MVALSITQGLGESNMKEVKVEHKGRVDYYKLDEEGHFVVSRGWRSWGAVTCCSSYMLTLVVMVWYAILGLIASLPFIVLAVAIGVAVAIILGYIGR